MRESESFRYILLDSGMDTWGASHAVSCGLGMLKVRWFAGAREAGLGRGKNEIRDTVVRGGDLKTTCG